MNEQSAGNCLVSGGQAFMLSLVSGLQSRKDDAERVQSPGLRCGVVTTVSLRPIVARITTYVVILILV